MLTAAVVDVDETKMMALNDARRSTAPLLSLWWWQWGGRGGLSGHVVYAGG